MKISHTAALAMLLGFSMGAYFDFPVISYIVSILINMYMFVYISFSEK